MRGILLTVLLLALLAPVGLLAEQQPQVTAQDVYDYINYTLEVSAQTRAVLLQAFHKGFEEGALAPERALSFLRRVNASGAPIELREQVLLTIADALLKSVPVEMLLSKVEEGLAKGRPMDEILAEIQERKLTLEGVKALFESKGFRAGIELQIGSATLTLSVELTGLVITDVAGALEDYVRSGKDPTDSFAVYQEVLLRLQRDRSIPPMLTEWVGANIRPEELGRIAQEIAARLREMR
ncbi:MAG: hypothetical protein NUW06_02315 [Candidatus Acetothermia bacterium]|nr:hypothetical protein [Candidatus Acetothermia bacterium]MDH7504599.1 hypothetical protein [Candidatus Acetothermia bacterium]